LTRADIHDGAEHENTLMQDQRLRARCLAVRSNRRRQSNDHCKQFDHADSNHQHRDCDRITPPCSSNLTTISLRGLCYFCLSSCWTRAAICGGTGAASASYWALRQCPSDSQTLWSRTKTARFRGGRLPRDWPAGCDADTREKGGTDPCPFADCDWSAQNSLAR